MVRREIERSSNDDSGEGVGRLRVNGHDCQTNHGPFDFMELGSRLVRNNGVGQVGQRRSQAFPWILKVEQPIPGPADPRPSPAAQPTLDHAWCHAEVQGLFAVECPALVQCQIGGGTVKFHDRHHHRCESDF
ncbi:MAG TPA: hypothetical protein VHM94_14170 [Acidimicrobiia bacterium]|nr:hypothetical protein [Acidimicrobiia bacterium]